MASTIVVRYRKVVDRPAKTPPRKNSRTSQMAKDNPANDIITSAFTMVPSPAGSHAAALSPHPKGNGDSAPNALPGVSRFRKGDTGRKRILSSQSRNQSFGDMENRSRFHCQSPAPKTNRQPPRLDHEILRRGQCPIYDPAHRRRRSIFRQCRHAYAFLSHPVAWQVHPVQRKVIVFAILDMIDDLQGIT